MKDKHLGTLSKAPTEEETDEKDAIKAVRDLAAYGEAPESP